MKKRLRFLEAYRFNRISPVDQLLGHIFFRSLCTSNHWDPNKVDPFEEDLFTECINLNEYAQLSSKTQSVIMANAARSDPDWRHTWVRIFTKTQHKINLDSLFSSWKACQTLALMHDAIVLILGPVRKYTRILDARVRNPNIFYYGGKTPFQLSEFAQTFRPSFLARVNDFTAFDQSQGGESVVLTQLRLKQRGIPSSYIQMFSYWKAHLECSFGALQYMKFTGEPWTWDDNTEYNQGVTTTRFIFSKNARLLFSGDDFSSDEPGTENPLWLQIEPHLKLKFKTSTTTYPTFCGYFIGNAGAIRAPAPLFAKLLIAEADETLPDKMASYLTEFSVGHSLGDSFWSLLPEEQVVYQCALFDFFCRRAPREQKIALKLGEVPVAISTRLINSGVRWLSRPLYALLNREARLRLVKETVGHRHHFFETSELEGILLSNFHATL